MRSFEWLKRRLWLPAIFLLACSAASAQNVRYEDFELNPTDGFETERFGSVTALDGDTSVVGAPRDDQVAEDSGAAFVFEFNGFQWIEIDKLLPTSGTERDRFGSSVAIAGDWIFVGSPDDDEVATNAGAVYIFRRLGEKWHLESKLSASDATIDNRFGSDIDIFGDILVIGAQGDSDRGVDAGAAYVYQLVGESWLEMAQLHASDAAEFDRFGSAVSLRHDVLVVGAPFKDGARSFVGAAYIYMYQGDQWVEVAKLGAPDAITFGLFGSAIDQANELIAVGCYNDDDRGGGSGSVYIFRSINSEWKLAAKLLSPTAVEDGVFGYSVAALGSGVLIGAPGEFNASGEETGIAHLFEYQGSSWQHIAVLASSGGAKNDRFGESVVLTEQRAMIGSPNHESVGSSFVYDFGPFFTCLRLEVANLVAGEDAVITVRGGNPSEGCAVLWGQSDGRFLFRIGPWCLDFRFHVPTQKLKQRVLFLGQFDANGELTRMIRIPQWARGAEVRFQAAMKNTCPATCMSNIVEERVR